jgi:hypothetical protein
MEPEPPDFSPHSEPCKSNTHPHHVYLRSVWILFSIYNQVFQVDPSLPIFWPKSFMYFSPFLCVCHIPNASHPPWFDQPHNIWLAVHIICIFLQRPVTSFPSGQKLPSVTISLCSWTAVSNNSGQTLCTLCAMYCSKQLCKLESASKTYQWMCTSWVRMYIPIERSY